MIWIGRAGTDHRWAIQALWEAEFGDGPDFVDRFAAWCGWEQIFLLWEDGEPRALTAAPLMELAMPGGGTARAGYVYAHTTLAAHRRRGLGRKLLLGVDERLREQGLDCVVLVPAQPSLFDYFATVGYEPGFFLEERTVEAATLRPAPAEGARPVSPAEYRVLREGLLAGIPHVASPLGLLEQQGELCRAAGGGLYRAETSAGPACAAVGREQSGSVFLWELLAPPGGEGEALAALHAAFGASSYTLRGPASGGGGRPFGAVKWYDGEKAARWRGAAGAYFGPALE